MIEIKDLTKIYGHVRAVDGISFDIPAGMVTGFLGPNGAGKSQGPGKVGQHGL